eukprot:6764946-Alexandrium_andersonii.AAC.1
MEKGARAPPQLPRRPSGRQATRPARRPVAGPTKQLAWRLAGRGDERCSAHQHLFRAMPLCRLSR